MNSPNRFSMTLHRRSSGLDAAFARTANVEQTSLGPVEISRLISESHFGSVKLIVQSNNYIWSFYLRIQRINVQRCSNWNWKSSVIGNHNKSGLVRLPGLMKNSGNPCVSMRKPHDFRVGDLLVKYTALLEKPFPLVVQSSCCGLEVAGTRKGSLCAMAALSWMASVRLTAEQ